jgi:hypothetical protein
LSTEGEFLSIFGTQDPEKMQRKESVFAHDLKSGIHQQLFEVILGKKLLSVSIHAAELFAVSIDYG